MIRERRERNPEVRQNPNTRRRIATRTSLEESKSDERVVAATTQESSDGIRQKVMRIASFDELVGGSSGAGRWSSPGGAVVSDRNRESQ